MEALKCVISHYREQLYKLDMLSRVEALRDTQNILFGLKALCQELPPRTGLSVHGAERRVLSDVHEGRVG